MSAGESPCFEKFTLAQGGRWMEGWPGQRNWGEMGAGGQVDQLQEEKQGQGRQS